MACPATWRYVVPTVRHTYISNGFLSATALPLVLPVLPVAFLLPAEVSQALAADLLVQLAQHPAVARPCATSVEGRTTTPVTAKLRP